MWTGKFNYTPPNDSGEYVIEVIDKEHRLIRKDGAYFVKNARTGSYRGLDEKHDDPKLFDIVKTDIAERNKKA